MSDPSLCRIDDFGPISVRVPQSVEEVGELVRQAAVEGLAVYPLGGRTMLDFGNSPIRPGIGIDLTPLDRVIDYPARDMTITVQAGITIAKLQGILQKENQRLPVDVHCADRATLGGALATNVSGPRRLGFGTFRDYVIGISAINDEGKAFKAGGRVVKNVAGYDLCKLLVGSLGTLGIVTQVTLKLRPIPEERALFLLPCESARLGDVLDHIHSSRTRPVCLELLNAAAIRYFDRQAELPADRSPWVLVVGFEDNREAVRWQIDQLLKEIGPEGARGCEARFGVESDGIWRNLVDPGTLVKSQMTFKANLLPRATAEFCLMADKLSENLVLQAHAGNGIVIGHATSDLTLVDASKMIAQLQAQAASAQGNVVILHCPVEWKASLPVWGRPRGDAFLMRRVKAALDPNGVFNPGRFIDGI